MEEDKGKKAPPLVERVTGAIRTGGDRGRDAFVRPGGLSDQAEGHFRRWFRKVWEVRGGGLYALGFAATFLYLEASQLVLDDIPTFLTLGSYEPAVLISFMVDFLIDTLMNTISAFIWPVYILQWWPPVGGIALIIAFILFPKYLKPHIEQWLLRDDPDA